MLLFHAELDSSEQRASSTLASDPTLYSTFLDSRPDALEVAAIESIISLQKAHPSLRTHIVHLSSAAALPLIRDAKAAGLPLTVETCFHYLCLTAAAIPAGRPEFKCCPPIRSAENQARLWEALHDGTIDFVVSDHSPCVARLKCLDTGDVMHAWGGIGGLGLGLSLLWTETRKRGGGMGRIVEWLSARTARHASLGDRKGGIELGKDADFVVFDPLAVFTVGVHASFGRTSFSSPSDHMPALCSRLQRTHCNSRISFPHTTDCPLLAAWRRQSCVVKSSGIVPWEQTASVSALRGCSCNHQSALGYVLIAKECSLLLSCQT